MSSRCIYLVASTGFPNYGDELVAKQWLQYLAVHEPDADVWLDSPSPGNSQLLLGHLHPRVRFVDTLFRICWAAPSEDPAEVVDFAAQATREPGVVPRNALGVEVLHTVDVFHILGGGYINALWPRHLAFLSAGSVLHARFDAIAAITGVGLTPSAAPAGMLDELTGTFQVVDVRDAPSRELFSSESVTESGADGLLEIGEQLYDQRESRSVMICAQSDLDAPVDAIAETIAGTLRKWDVDSSRVGYVECMPGVDRIVFDKLLPDLPEMRFYPFVEVWREGIPARRGQRWLTTRFNAHLVAAAAGAWGVAIRVNEDYYGVKHGSLLDRGSRWTSVAAGEISEEVHGEPGFGSALAGQIEAKQAVAQRIYAR
jgi:hypothetical protein